MTFRPTGQNVVAVKSLRGISEAESQPGFFSHRKIIQNYTFMSLILQHKAVKHRVVPTDVKDVT